jgi:hypothetical protein
MDGYGGKCACCGEGRDLSFLSIDHINNDGAKFRKENPTIANGTHLYRWIEKVGFPKDLQVYCFSCQWGKRIHGVCPHQWDKDMRGDGEGI